MATFTPKTNWQTNDIVKPEDMNRIEQGVYDASFVFSEDGETKYKWLVDMNGIVCLEEAVE